MPRAALDFSSFAKGLQEAHDFAMVGRFVCHNSEKFGLVACGVALNAPDGRPIIVVDNVANLTEQMRLNSLDMRWLDKMLLCALRTHHGPLPALSLIHITEPTRP
jgi:hypothetical protein